MTTKGNHNVDGLTKREYFAAKALQGLLSQHTKDKYVDDSLNKLVPAYDMNDDFEQETVAYHAVTLADMLIEKLNEVRK